jgi:hypothetical protein
MNIGFAGQTVTLAYPADVDETVRLLFAHHAVSGDASNRRITLRKCSADTFELTGTSVSASPRLKTDDLPEFLMEAVIRELITDQSNGVVLHAAAVGRADRAILLSGVSGAGKSTLTAWLAENGYEYLTDELVFIPSDSPLTVTPFRRPLTLRSDSLQTLEDDGTIDPDKPRLAYGNKAVFPLPSTSGASQHPVGAIVFPSYAPDADLRVEPLDSGQTALRLLENNLNGENLADGGLASIAQLASAVPAFRLFYSDFEQLEDVLDPILDNILDKAMTSRTWHRVHSAFGKQAVVSNACQTPPPPAARPINAKTPSPRGDYPLTIGMATYDDYDGVYFSIQSLRLNNPELTRDVEFLVIDNHPDGPCGDALKDLEKISPSYRYVPFAGQTGTAIRDLVFSEARGEFVLCMDCHVLLAPGVLERLMDFLKRNPDSKDLYQGPMIYDGLDSFSTHFDPVWNGGMYGTWGTDDRAQDPDAEPFDIPMQGLGLFVCRRAAWPGFNLKFSGFGGEEGYIHEKIRQRGGRTLCLPFLRWLHRFPRPMGVPYKLRWDDRVRNYMIGFRELGLETDEMIAHFEELLGEEPTKRIVAAVEAELANPFNRFDAARYINLDGRHDRREAVERRFESLGILQLVKRFPAFRTEENHHVGCALSHREIVADASRRGLKNVLVFEDDVIFRQGLMDHLPAVLDELETADWDLLYLGGHCWGETFPLLPGCSHLRRAGAISTTHAIAYNASAFDKILREVPADPEAMEKWIATHYGIDQYLAKEDFRRLLTDPILAMQPELVNQPDNTDRHHFGY